MTAHLILIATIVAGVVALAAGARVCLRDHRDQEKGVRS